MLAGMAHQHGLLDVSAAYGYHHMTQLDQQHQHQPESQQQRNGKKSRMDYSNSVCAICNAQADGLHYGAISCRSCNAFFRRAVTFKQTFLCRKGGNCDVDVSVRCACRACRLAKCKAAGMRECDVQPKRDPTGSQKNRRAPQRRRNQQQQQQFVVKTEMPDQQQEEGHSPNSLLLPSVESLPLDNKALGLGVTCLSIDENPYQTLLSPSSVSFPPSAESGIFEEAGAVQFIKSIKKEDFDEEEEEDGEEEESSDEQHKEPRRAAQEVLVTSRLRADERSPTMDDDQAEFDKLVRDYREHLAWMNCSMRPIEDFLSEEFGSCSKWRVMQPEDVEQLSKVELGGLMYWIDKLWPFRRLTLKDRETLFKRYSVRKISLDHFYIASKYPELLAKGLFPMPNNTYVPPDRTGFETVTDDKHTREAKFQILRPTIDRLWHTVVLPFTKLGISDAEVVTLHLLLMCSQSNNRHMEAQSRQLLAQRREWAIQRLHRHLQNIGHAEPLVRLGEILLLLPELEVVCDAHCKDFQVAQLFEFCNMSEYWYEKYCYTSLNIT